MALEHISPRYMRRQAEQQIWQSINHWLVGSGLLVVRAELNNVEEADSVWAALEDAACDDRLCKLT